jgi:hypothetical protein
VTLLLLNWLKKPGHPASSVSATTIEGDDVNKVVRKSYDGLNEPVDDPFSDKQGKTTSRERKDWPSQLHVH